MWRKRKYSNNSALRKRKQKRVDKRSRISQDTQSTTPDGNIIHQSASAAEVEHLPNTTNNVLEAAAESIKDSRDRNKTRDAPLNQELEPLGSDDWNWLRTNDSAIREQRRFAGDDGSPRTGTNNDLHDVAKSKTVHPTPFEESHLEPEVGLQARGLSEEIASEELDPLRPGGCVGEHAGSKNVVQVAGDNMDTFFELYPSQQPDDNADEAQLRFEQELEEEQQGTRPGSTLDDLEDIVEEESDDWYDRTEGSSLDKTPGFEWHELSFDAEDFDEAPDPEWSREVRTDGRVSRELRALQEATILAQEYAWDERGTKLLAEVFERYFWSSAKTSMRRELEGGMTPEELEVALRLRDFWRGRTEFSIDLGYRRSGTGYGADTSRAIYNVLSWPAALRLIRMANSIPDQAEIEVFLDELYREWYSSSILRRRYASFRVYLYRWLDYVENRSDLVGTWSARIDVNLEADFNEDDECDSARLSYHRHELAYERLLPTSGDEQYVEMMSNAERKVLGKALAARSEQCP